MVPGGKVRRCAPPYESFEAGHVALDGGLRIHPCNESKGRSMVIDSTRKS